jgi:hypothetical protein
MGTDKIKISTDEVYSSGVDNKLKSQDAIARAQQHYQQQISAAQQVSAIKATVPGKTSIWYNAIFYMALFGLIGGIIAWGTAELVHDEDTQRRQFGLFLQIEGRIIGQHQNGEISGAKAMESLDKLKAAFADNPYVVIYSDPNIDEKQTREAIDQLREKDKAKSMLRGMVWLGLIGIFIAVSISAAEHVVSRNWRAVGINSCIALFLGVLGAVIVSLFINELYNALLGDSVDRGMGRQMLARSIAWGVLGMFLAIAPGIVIRNWKRFFIGLVGGLAGGLLGGLLFDPIAEVTDSGVLSRLVGIVGIGVFAAVGTGLIERAVRTGWLKVVSGLIAGKQFILYRNPTNIGSSPQCEIYLFKDTQVAPRHASIHLVPGGCEIENTAPGMPSFVNGQAVSRKRLRSGDQIQIGSTVFEFEEKERH